MPGSIVAQTERLEVNRSFRVTMKPSGALGFGLFVLAILVGDVFRHGRMRIACPFLSLDLGIDTLMQNTGTDAENPMRACPRNEIAQQNPQFPPVAIQSAAAEEAGAEGFRAVPFVRQRAKWCGPRWYRALWGSAVDLRTSLHGT